jgi:hypothetical protein
MRKRGPKITIITTKTIITTITIITITTTITIITIHGNKNAENMHVVVREPEHLRVCKITRGQTLSAKQLECQTQPLWRK